MIPIDYLHRVRTIEDRVARQLKQEEDAQRLVIEDAIIDAFELGKEYMKDCTEKEAQRQIWAYGSGPGTLAGDNDL